jgi:DNA polymerase-3 subunit epsilon
MRSLELVQFYRQLSSQLFTVVDVETTGYRGDRDRVTELSVLQATLTDGVLDHRTQLVNPEILIPPKIVEFTGITQAMVDAAPAAAAVFPAYWPLLTQGVLTAHNLRFDYAFLQGEYGRIGYVFERSPQEQLCTVELSRLLLAELPSRSLPKLVAHFGFEVGRSHRAEADTLACWLLTQRLFHDLLNQTDDTLVQRVGQQWIPLALAARMLGCGASMAQTRLAQAGVRYRMGRGRSPTPLYRRGEVERVMDQA